MKYKESKLDRWYLNMPTLYVYTYEDGTLLYYRHQINFRVDTNDQPLRYYYEDGTLEWESWYGPNGFVKRYVDYSPDGSVLREITY